MQSYKNSLWTMLRNKIEGVCKLKILIKLKSTYIEKCIVITKLILLRGIVLENKAYRITTTTHKKGKRIKEKGERVVHKGEICVIHTLIK